MRVAHHAVVMNGLFFFDRSTTMSLEMSQEDVVKYIVHAFLANKWVAEEQLRRFYVAVGLELRLESGDTRVRNVGFVDPRSVIGIDQALRRARSRFSHVSRIQDLVARYPEALLMPS